jgi:hypothetical protein
VDAIASMLATSVGEPGWRVVSEMSPGASATNGTIALPCASVVAVANPSVSR